MTELLPSGEKVEVTLGDDESVTVPSGKTWKVYMGGQASDTFATVYYTPDGGTQTAIMSMSDSAQSPGSELTLHENGTVKTDRYTEVTIIGWEFDYSA